MPNTENLHYLKNAWKKTKEHQLMQALEDEYGFQRPVCRSLIYLMNEFSPEHYGRKRGENQILMHAVDMYALSGRSFEHLPLIEVNVTISHPEDAMILEKKGIKGLRQHKLIRLACEAYDQGGLLIQEDLALLLTTSSRTIQRDIKELRDLDIIVPTRGSVLENGHQLSDRCENVCRFIQGKEIPEIAEETLHTHEAVRKHIRQFADTIILYARDYSADQIIELTGLTPKVIGEYLLLYEMTDLSSQPRLNSIFSSYTPGIIQRPMKIDR